MRKFMLGALAAFVLMASPAIAMAAAAGTAKGVDPAADAVSGAATRTLTVGADINIGDVIKTGPAGQVEILFADSTKLVVGPNSSLEIQDYLIRTNGSAGKFAVDMLAGTFRFVTGTSPKPDYIINTPTGTIGVRGTAFDVFVDDKGVAHIMMYQSTSIMCEKHAKLCKDLADLCEIGQIDQSNTSIVGNANDMTGEQRDLIKSYFHYSIDESSLDREFRIPHAYECTHKPPELDIPAPPISATGFAGPNCECGYEGYYSEGEGEGGCCTQ
jgi:FecR-like protein